MQKHINKVDTESDVGSIADYELKDKAIQVDKNTYLEFFSYTGGNGVIIYLIFRYILDSSLEISISNY